LTKPEKYSKLAPLIHKHSKSLLLSFHISSPSTFTKIESLRPKQATHNIKRNTDKKLADKMTMFFVGEGEDPDAGFSN